MNARTWREAVDPEGPARRAAAANAAGRDVYDSALDNEDGGVETLLARLQQLKRELQGVIAVAGASPFRRFTAQSLIDDVDRMIAQATRDIQTGSRSALSGAATLGVSAVNGPITAARIAIGGGPQLDAELVTRAYDATADLLTEPMQQFRGQVVRAIRRASLMGDATSSQLQQLASDIDSAGFESAAFKAERILRTETGRVLNESTYGRMVALASQMPFLRKGWRAANDNRTRVGHREASKTYARGSGSIPVADPFRINVYQEPRTLAGGRLVAAKLLGVVTMRFPIDPLTEPQGRLSAASTIMCRCNAFTDFDLGELSAWSTSRSRSVTPGAPTSSGPSAGFAEPPITKRPPAPVPVRPTEIPTPELSVARRDPASLSAIPGGVDLLSAYGPDVVSALEEAYTEMIAASRFDEPQGRWREVLQTINADGTRGALVIGGDSYVNIPEALAKEMAASAVWIHTHPSGTAFSFADLTQLARVNDGEMRMLVFGNYGTWHELRAPLDRLPQGPASTPLMRAIQRSYETELIAASQRATARTDRAAADLARDAGVSVWQLRLSTDGMEELQTLFKLHMQEETAEAWLRLAAQWGFDYRFYLPPASTTDPRHRSRS